MWGWERSAAGKLLPSVCVHELPARSTVGAGAVLLLGTAWGLDGVLCRAAETFLALQHSLRALSVWHGAF